MSRDRKEARVKKAGLTSPVHDFVFPVREVALFQDLGKAKATSNKFHGVERCGWAACVIY